MAKKKRKILKMTEEDYNNYIMALKDETPILIKPKKEDDTNKK